jgi:hypothetical protein
LRTERFFLTALLLAGAAPLAAQDARLAERLPAGTAREVQRVVDSATAQGLPGGPLVLKALEGASKGADSARILAAVRALASMLGTAHGALGPSASEAELVAGAAALRAGAGAQSLVTLRKLRSAEPLVVPLSVLADLLTAGVDTGRAWNSVRDMASRGATDAAFLAMRDELVAPGRGRTVPPAVERPPANPLPPARSRP